MSGPSSSGTSLMTSGYGHAHVRPCWRTGLHPSLNVTASRSMAGTVDRMSRSTAIELTNEISVLT
jgi:hypothetical protein